MIFFFLVGKGFPPPALASNPSVLTAIRIDNTPKFVRLRFLFKGRLPHRSSVILRGKTLILYFPGSREGAIRKRVKGKRHLVKRVRTSRTSKGLEIRILLATSRIEYVKYQRRKPPQVLVSLRHAKGKKARHSLSSRRKKLLPQREKGKRVHLHKSAKPSTRKPVPRGAGGKAVALAEAKKRLRAVAEGAHPAKKIQSGEKESPIPAPSKGTTPPRVPAPSPQMPAVSTLPPAKNPAVKALFDQAERARKRGDYEKAAGLFKEVFHKSPRSREGEASAFYWVKSLYLLEKGREKATLKVADAYEEILKKYPHAPWGLQALRDLARQYTALTFYNQAIDVYRRIIRKFPHSTDAEEALFRIGDLQLEKRSFKTAEGTFRAYIKQYPEGKYLRDVTYLLGDALYYQGNTQQAVDLYQTAMKRWPHATSTDLKTLENMAALFEKNGDMDRALDLLFMAVNLSSSKDDAAELMYHIAMLYKKEGRYREALKVFSNILAQYPGSHMAAQSVIAMAELSETHPGIKYNGFQFGIDPYEFPLQAYASLLKNQRDPFVLKKALLGEGRLLLRRDPGKAIPLLLRVTQSYPETVEAQKAAKLLNRAFYAVIVKNARKGRLGRCIQLYRRYLKAGLEENPRLLLEVAQCYLKMKDIAHAEKILKTLHRAAVPADLKDGYDYDVISLTFSKGDMKKTLYQSLAFLKRYPKSAKRREVFALLKMALAGLEGKKADPLIETTIQSLLTTLRVPMERAIAEKILVSHVEFLNSRQEGQAAEVLIKWYLEKFPHNNHRFVFYRLLGDTYFQAGKYAQAERAYRTALKGTFGKAFQAQTLYRLGLSRMKLKKYAQARAAFGLSEGLLDRIKDPLPPATVWLRRQVRLEKAELFFREGKNKEAIAAFQAFLKKAPKGEQRDWALYRLGVLYGKQRNIQGVTQVYETLSAQASDPFWKRNAEDLKTTLGWFVKHADEFRKTQKETHR